MVSGQRLGQRFTEYIPYFTLFLFSYLFEAKFWQILLLTVFTIFYSLPDLPETARIAQIDAFMRPPLPFQNLQQPFDLPGI